MDFNFIILNDSNQSGDAELFFGDHEGNLHDDITIEITPDKDMYDILVMTNIFKSKGDARKNWTKTGKEIPWGFSYFRVGKLRHTICILNTLKDKGDECSENKSGTESDY